MMRCTSTDYVLKRQIFFLSAFVLNKSSCVTSYGHRSFRSYFLSLFNSSEFSAASSLSCFSTFCRYFKSHLRYPCLSANVTNKKLFCSSSSLLLSDDEKPLPCNFELLKVWASKKNQKLQKAAKNIEDATAESKDDQHEVENNSFACNSLFSSSPSSCLQSSSSPSSCLRLPPPAALGALKSCVQKYMQIERDIHDLSQLLCLTEVNGKEGEKEEKYSDDSHDDNGRDARVKKKTQTEEFGANQIEKMEEEYFTVHSTLLEVKKWNENTYMIDIYKELKEKEKEIYHILLNILEDKNFNTKEGDGENTEKTNSFDNNSLIFEVRPGVGGEEACIFAKEVFHMYEKFCERNDFNFSCIYISHNSSKIGYKEAVADISGEEVLSTFRYECGVHRVQRIPCTDKKQNKMHTSTATVSVIHKAIHTQHDLVLKNNEVRVETMRSGGPGGQSVNKGESAVRITHLPTNLSVVVQHTPSQLQNKAYAMALLKSKLLNQKKADISKYEKEAREKQIGSGDRSEKIRTYNFQHDFLQDHRCGITLKGVREILEEGSQLDMIIRKLKEDAEKTKIENAIMRITNNY